MVKINEEDAKLLKLASQIKPMVRAKNRKRALSYIEPVDLNENYLKKPKICCKAPKVKVIATIMTSHANAINSIFTSSEKEVLTQIGENCDEEVLENAIGFQTKMIGYSDMRNLQFSRTEIYGLEKEENIPARIKSQNVILNGKEFSNDEIGEIEI